MKIKEQAMVKHGRQERGVYGELELDIEALGQMALDNVNRKFEALYGAIKCCVRLPKR